MKKDSELYTEEERGRSKAAPLFLHLRIGQSSGYGSSGDTSIRMFMILPL